jgi:hypothetical protein
MDRSLGALEAQRLRLQRSIDELHALRLEVEQAECQKPRDSQLARVLPFFANPSYSPRSHSAELFISLRSAGTKRAVPVRASPAGAVHCPLPLAVGMPRS